MIFRSVQLPLVLFRRYSGDIQEMMSSSQEEFNGWSEDRKDDGWRERNWKEK